MPPSVAPTPPISPTKASEAWKSRPTPLNVLVREKVAHGTANRAIILQMCRSRTILATLRVRGPKLSRKDSVGVGSWGTNTNRQSGARQARQTTATPTS